MKETGVNMGINCNGLQPVGPQPKTYNLFMQNDNHSWKSQKSLVKNISRGWVGAGKRNLKKNWHKKNGIEPTCLHTTTGVAFTFKLDFSWLKHLDCI